MKICPHCNSLYDKRVRINGDYSCPNCSEPISAGKATKICPECDFEFSRFKTTIVFEIKDLGGSFYRVKGGHCPGCGCDLVYRKDRAGTVAITLDDRIAADHMIQRLNMTIRERTNSDPHDLDEATGKERLTAYRFINWGRDKLKSYASDVGKSPNEFLEGMITYALTKMDWYRANVNSLIMLWNQKARLAGLYYEYELARNYQQTEHDLTLKVKLQQLYSMM